LVSWLATRLEKRLVCCELAEVLSWLRLCGRCLYICLASG